MASEASTMAVKPRHSIIPNASLYTSSIAQLLSVLNRHRYAAWP
jgi:hypothetical protein